MVAGDMTQVPRLAVPYIAVEGCIGAGKTTLAGALGEALGFQPVLELVEWNPFLEDLYRDPSAHAMQAMLTFLSVHFHQLQRAIQGQASVPGILSDYLYAREALFANAIVGQPHQEREWKIVMSVFEYFNERLPMPTLVIYLRAPTDLLLERIRTRARPYEQAIDASYVDTLNASYERFFESYTDARVLTLDARGLDEGDPGKLKELVMSQL